MSFFISPSFLCDFREELDAWLWSLEPSHKFTVKSLMAGLVGRSNEANALYMVLFGRIFVKFSFGSLAQWHQHC